VYVYLYVYISKVLLGIQVDSKLGAALYVYILSLKDPRQLHPITPLVTPAHIQPE